MRLPIKSIASLSAAQLTACSAWWTSSFRVCLFSMLNGNDSRPSSEDEPLLSAGEGNDQNRYPDYQKGRKRSSLNKLILYFMAIHFLLAFTEIILIAPLIKLFENSLCRSYYDFPSHGIPEDLCKVPDIQRPLATIRGWKSTFDTFPGKQEPLYSI